MKTFVTTLALHAYSVAPRFRATQFSLATDESGALVATSFGDLASLQKRADLGPPLVNASLTRAAVDQITAYFAGELTRFTLRLAPRGSPFQHRVWAALQSIPFGETRSYGELAKDLQSSPRAIGRANATNPICLVVPCHRVIGADGSLTGFAFGEDVKSQLLEHEAEFAATQAAASFSFRR